MYLLIPGRHQLLTQFQFDYLQSVINKAPGELIDIYGKSQMINEPIEAVIFAVTSSNHSNTRRNPLPFYLRAISIEAFGNALNVPVFIYGIDDVGSLEKFASYTIKRIRHDSELFFDLNPSNTLVVCSTSVMKMYEAEGYTILPAELQDVVSWKYRTVMPWDIVEYIAGNEQWKTDQWLQQKMHPASLKVWKKYNLGSKVQLLFKDHMIGSDGDLTDTRDYNVYVRQMDEIAEMKYNDTATYIQPGRVGDIGCAVGSWIRLASRDERFRESDLYGIEVSRHLYDICQQRKLNGEFNNPFVFFSQRNAVTGLVFERNTMNTIHTSSLTHEIASYGSIRDLQQFIRNRFQELTPGGVWINRDVVGPLNKQRKVLMVLNREDGKDDATLYAFKNKHELALHLQSLSTWSRFFWFANQFRKAEGYQLQYELRNFAGKDFIELSLKDAAEFMSRKDYTDNWQSEMHETFCFWDFEEWQHQLESVGFKIQPESKAFTNEWIVNERLRGKVELCEYIDGRIMQIPYPVTTMILIGVKQ
jgi:SAM-dependent methyltransferase